MKFSYNWIRSLSGPNTPSPNELGKMLTLKLFEVEEIKERGNDWILDIDILPNRAGDCFSHIGIAREVSAIMGLKFIEPFFVQEFSSPKESGAPAKKLISIKVSDHSDCPRYVAKVVVGVKVGPSPKWIKERLEVCGVQSINNVVDAANYVMLETGQPLHAFDLDQISGEIIVRRAKKGEKIVTLDGKEIELNEDILLIADKEKPLGIAGIKGGRGAEISSATKNIVIESASFDRKVIRKGSSLLKIRTDASLRFEHGFDPNLNQAAADRAASLIAEVAKGKIVRGRVDIYQKKILPKIIPLDLKKASEILGVEITKKTALKTLLLLGFKVKEDRNGILSVGIPTRRVDLSIEEDLIEEIGRMIGYDKISSRPPRVEVVSHKINSGLIWERRIKETLRAAGFSETYNHTFISENQAKKIGSPLEELFEVEAPVSVEQRFLRPSLMPHLGSNVRENRKFFQDVNLFELGKTFSKNSGERKMLSGVMTGESFYQIKGVIEFLLNEMGVEEIEYLNPTNLLYLDSSRSSYIIAKGSQIGIIGYASEDFCKELRVDSDFSLFELDFDKMVSMASEEMKYESLPKHPEVNRDLAIVVPANTPFKEIPNLIKKCRIKSLKEILLFDLYCGRGIPKGKKSLALRLTFRENKTLTTKEVNESQKTIMEAIEKQDGWQVRK